ncbi:unnamed protein product (macronuclear) [Paramecium tetraurelia]|uniref:Uncharacterized protein n=1 Tax=Paramecium tetraurelia TaxID=5888 RepID=A0E4R9_PARTE|nr:uncharacterized protein GSPATT00023461001 [Paramecium tetraurelia]CAK90286.1 unnamed protein product [Paramecium tetraurelia]|eukprot:XP_001457683.1 hypothetical protein (macronuclear) [Paramecium tetraurelia strain d4-2]
MQVELILKIQNGLQQKNQTIAKTISVINIDNQSAPMNTIKELNMQEKNLKIYFVSIN